MEIDHNKNNELQAKALEVYRQKESVLSEILLGSITEDVFNPANIDSSTPIAKMYQNICGRFGQQENIPELQTEFYNSKLRYGDNARGFYRDLQVIFNKLRKANPTIGEQGLRHQAVQALPLELEQVKYEVYDQTETEYNYDNLVDEIVRKYDIRIKLNPPIKNIFERQRCINTPETKLSSQPQLSPANYRTLMTGRFPPDTAFFDQGSDVTCTCRLDLLTNIRQLNTPERFGTLSSESNSSLEGTMQLNLGHKNGTINWIETEAYYSPHYNSTILSVRIQIQG
ncbi:hypothetical protein E3Q16_04214 [Wallemia mellicola]|nr:hypothetical protein E3Q16_04214 [Wallemia mellicola]